MGPKVFISSTYYDLKYIREDLSQFVKNYKFEAILFENGDIGYEPGKPLDESCYRYISKSDMVILIVGGLYGSPATGEIQDKFNEYMSITRKEFQAAKDADIPIFVFIDSEVALCLILLTIIYTGSSHFHKKNNPTKKGL